MLPFESTNVSASDFLQGKKGTPVMIAGHLRLPKMEGKQPVVVLMHGAPAVGGSEAQVDTWARALNEAGIGAFVVDSFSGRGVNSFADLGKISPLVRVADAYGALGKTAEANREAAERSLNLPASLFTQHHLAKAAYYWKQRPAKGAKRLFLVDFTHEDFGHTAISAQGGFARENLDLVRLDFAQHSGRDGRFEIIDRGSCLEQHYQAQRRNKSDHPFTLPAITPWM